MWLKWIILFSLTSSAWAYRFTNDFNNVENGGSGLYWQNLPISITVLETDASRKSMLEDLSRAAIQTWEDSTQLAIWDYTGSGTKNIIRWSKNFAKETKMDPESVLAVAIRYTKGPYFAKTEIIINGSHPYNAQESLLRTTLTHELGHTMGLDHSEVDAAVMAPTLQPYFHALHEDDISGMQAAYAEMESRQLRRYVSPLSYENEESEAQPLSCGTVGPATAQAGNGMNGILSLAGGLLISFVRKVLGWFKKYF